MPFDGDNRDKFDLGDKMAVHFSPRTSWRVISVANSIPSPAWMPFASFNHEKNDFYEKMTKSVSNEPRLTNKAEVRLTSAPRPDLRTGVGSKTQNLPETDFFW
ncbi:hypothetical protein Zmor_009102 [Zophobas morio]|uniref:Uncharacterized protein n=1 Tax=Zophobas morio TaxID=2755281 RepID=A0AA38IKY5_9CUCU|nr:hypothetical protein Zmor_009102 [Zophobas morio]